jgi:outer membrane immunogenic protein
LPSGSALVLAELCAGGLVMRLSVLALAGMTICASSAAYADGYATRSAPAYVPFSWTGLYIGANAGYAWGARDSEIVLSLNGPNGAADFPIGRSFDAQGRFIGGQVGYNWQRGPLVLGVEADIQSSRVADSFPPENVPNCPCLLNGEKRLDYFGTVRGRLGFALDRFLVYGTGGFAYGHVNDTLFLLDTITGVSANMREDDVRSGWTAGGGVEYAFSRNLSLKVEYQRLDLGGERLSAPVLPVTGVIFTSSRIEHAYDTVRLGLNYRFDSDRYVPLK